MSSTRYIHVFIGIFPVRIAPFAVFLIEHAVVFLADVAVLKGHAAALAYEFAGRAQKGIDGNVKKL